MMNQGATADSLATLDASSAEKHQGIGSSQPHISSYHVPTGSTEASWSMHGTDNYPRENGGFVNPTYNHNLLADSTLGYTQDGLNMTSAASSSSSGLATITQDYSSYTNYTSTDPYTNTGYPAYYNGYQQQSNQSYPQPVGAYQNTGAPYQPLSSFQNTGSYAGPANYSSTYYNPGDYQTSGGYAGGVYNNEANLWHGGQYTSYTHPYPNYTLESNAGYVSAGGAAAFHYQQHNKQWADYYSQTPTEVTCAPGTENVSVATASTLSCPVPTVSAAYPTPTSQAPAPYTPSWRPESSSAELSSVQPVSASATTHDDYWKYVTQMYQNYQTGSAQPNIQKPVDPNPHESSQPNSTHSQAPTAPYAASFPVPQSYQSSLQPAPSNVPPLDSRRIGNMQIPTNPRITSNLALGLPKTNKEVSTITAAAKPAYVSISLPKSSEKASSHDSVNSVLKPGMFPKSLCGYVERALARCKDDAQMGASQAVMKEIITKATADGTLYSKDWDTEPLFALPSMDTFNKEGSHFSAPVPLQSKRSPSRRTKSRWEPVVEEKSTKKSASTAQETEKYGNWGKQFSVSGNKDLSASKYTFSTHKTPNQDSQRPAKRPKFGNSVVAADNGEASSDSDKDQDLTAYYSSALAIAGSPEERKRRESRSKRFESSRGNRAEKNHFRSKSKGSVGLYTRRATALVIGKNFEESGSRAVEDIDWDALTVKGTCQEIEKRYLRLTSAPDPATVRPEEVLEKALNMVQNSEKNYLYKCDQLKSIRQDLTVQRIRNQLTVKVYETHARLAIEYGDLPEFNQCQSQLKTLYAEGIKGCYMEFAAYHLLCVILHSNNNRDLLSAMARLSADARKNEAVKHALAVRSAVTSGNYVLFFRLYKNAPNLNTWLMDRYVEKMRYAAVRCMSRSYRPMVSVSYIAQVLGFSSASDASNGKDIDAVEECAEWLKAHGAILTSDTSGEMLLDTKASMSSLYIPEPEDAVAHGDSNLGLNDFFARQPVQTG